MQAAEAFDRHFYCEMTTFIFVNVQVRDDSRRAGVMPDETTITNDELKGQLQCVYQERIAAQSPSRR